MVIERAQFAHNPKIYEQGAFKDEMGFDGSWLDWFLLETERTCGECQEWGHGFMFDVKADSSQGAPLHEVSRSPVGPRRVNTVARDAVFACPAR